MTADIIHKLGANSAIYATTNLLQKGTAFLLMPLYTLYLDPTAYGVLAIITAVNGLLSIAFTLGLTGAVTRFYVEYQEDPQRLAEFWGTILGFVMLLSTAVGGVLFMIGETLLRPLIGAVPFWPYVALGIATTFFQPFFATFLAVLQTRNQAGRYALVSLAHFALTTLLTIALVVLLGWGVAGALGATLVAAAVFFVVSLRLLRADIKLCLNWVYLRRALSYSLPQVPHSLASQASAITDRIVLNSQVGTGATGLYAVGAMVGMIVEVAAQGVNRAYVPLSMAALKRGQPQDLAQLRALGALIVAGFCVLGATIGCFGREILWLLTPPAFSAAAPVIPVLVFAGVASAIYYLFVNILFYDFAGVRLLPLGALSGAALNLVLALLLVPRFGLIGAAVATLLAQTLVTLLIACVGRRYDPVAWDYGRYALAFVASLCVTLGLAGLESGQFASTAALKLAGVAALGALLGALFWSRPLILAEAAWRLLARRPADAAALFAASHRAAP